MAEATEAKEPRAKASPKETEGAPAVESGPALVAAHEVYPPARGNWSDPPELAEDESNREGSLALPVEEEIAGEREKLVKEARERFTKAREANDKQIRARAEYDAKRAKGAA